MADKNAKTQVDKRAVRAGMTYWQERTHVRPHLMAYCRHVSAGHVIAHIAKNRKNIYVRYTSQSVEKIFFLKVVYLKYNCTYI